MLLNCIAYQEGKKLADIDIEHISDYINRPDCFVWVALKDASADELERMKNEFNLHELAIEDAAHGHQRPKIEEYDNDLFVVMHLLEEIEGSSKLQIGEVSIFVGTNYILSIRNKSTHDLLGVRAYCERHPAMLAKGSGYVLYALMDAIVDRYFPLIEKLETTLESIEERMFSSGNATHNIKRLYRLKRRVSTIRHAITPLMEAASKLHAGRIPVINENTRAYFRDVYDHLARINASVDNIRDTLSTAIQVNLSLVAIEHSENSKKLAAWAGIFAVPTAFAGIWGMNFEHMPELATRWGYPIALLVIIGSCALLFRQFKKVKWL